MLNPDVGFALNNRHRQPSLSAPKSATTGLMHRSETRLYSITSSARASRDGGTVRPSALAVLRLISSSYLVGACTGRSAGFSPLHGGRTLEVGEQQGHLPDTQAFLFVDALRPEQAPERLSGQ